jgi:tripartite-type tricarboxylate transporter receptor subunit TctC
MVIPGAAGSQPDQVGRYFAPYPSERLGDQVIVENVSGGGGTIGANRVAKAGSDGHQFVLGNAGTHAMTQVLHNLHLGGRHAEFC